MLDCWQNGVVLGKFMPLHLGHEHLIDTAIQHCSFLTVVVCTLRREPINGDLRYRWTQHRYEREIRTNRVQVCHLKEEWFPQEPNDCHSEKVFYGTWAGVLRALAGAKIDVIFSSEDYGDSVAQYLECDHFMVDKQRLRFPVSGTMIRSDPERYLHYLNDEVAGYFHEQKNFNNRT